MCVYIHHFTQTEMLKRKLAVYKKKTKTAIKGELENKMQKNQKVKNKNEKKKKGPTCGVVSEIRRGHTKEKCLCVCKVNTHPWKPKIQWNQNKKFPVSDTAIPRRVLAWDFSAIQECDLYSACGTILFDLHNA